MKGSKQAIIITTIISFIVPRLISLSDFGIVNKLVWKGLLSGAFSISTLIVGILFSCHLLRDRMSGGKTRIGIFITIVFALCVFAPIIATVVDVTTKITITIIATAIAMAMTFGIYKLTSLFGRKTKHCIHNKHQQISNSTTKEFVSSTKRINIPQTTQPKTITSTKSTITTAHSQNIIVSQQETQSESKKELDYTTNRKRTLYELAVEHDFSCGCMTVTNEENPDLKWVKIYKPQYANGKFYGYIKMNNARHTVNGVIYFADRPIWKLA